MTTSQPTALAEAPAAPSYIAVPDREHFRETLDNYVKARWDLSIAWMSLTDDRQAMRDAAEATYLRAREELWGLVGLVPDDWNASEGEDA